MLETGGVGGVTGDGNADLFEFHDSNAFRNVIGTVATNGSTCALGVRNFFHDLYGFGVRIEFGLYVGETVDTGNDHSGVFAETVQDNAKGIDSDFVGVQCDFDSALCGCEGFVTGKEAETLGFFGKKHFAEVTVAKTYFSVLGNRAGNAERLKTYTDFSSGVSGFFATGFDGNGSTDGVCPNCVFKANRLGSSDDFVAVNTLGESDFFALFDRADAVFFQDGEDLCLTSFIVFKQCHVSSSYHSLRGSMYLTAPSSAVNLP